MGTFSPRVLSMKTGYDYSTTGSPTPANQYRHLKCSYLFIAMTHMRLVRYILDDKNTETGVSVSLLGKYNIRAVICTLHDVADVEIGTLWILLFYVNMTQPYYKDYILNADETDRTAAVNHLVLIHDYVAGRMQRELSNAHCPPGNQFDSYEKRYRRIRRAMPSDQFLMNIVHTEAVLNCNELDDLLKANNAHLTYGKRYEALRPRALFLDKLADNNRKKNRMMNVYDLQITWQHTPTLLTEYYQDVQKLHSNSALFHPLLPVKTYYRGVFGLIKCITYRLSWKFLFHFNLFTGECRENYLKEFHDVLVRIQAKLRLQDDQDFMHLLECIDQLCRDLVGVDHVITKIQTRMRRFDVILRCKATNSWTLKSEQPSTSADQGTADQEDTILDILKTTKTFLVDLRFDFKTVDFDVVKSIVMYVEDESKW